MAGAPFCPKDTGEWGNGGIIMGASRFGQLEISLEFYERGPLPQCCGRFGAGVVANKGDGTELLAP